jgi:glycosyltransferase involved in cell wall biosynthesis
VRPAIESALRQTFTDLEIIIVDDASVDNIEEIVSFYSDPRIRFIKNPKNLGQFGNFNRCIEVSHGEILHILHSDDYIDSHFTDTCVKFFDQHPDVFLTFTSEIRQSPERTEKKCFSERDEIIPAPEGFEKLLRLGCFISCPSVMTRRSVYEAVGGYSYEFPIAADYYQWLKISRRFDIGFVKDAIVYYNEGIHSESYRFFISNPTGYLDRVKIVLQTITDVKDEYQKFLPDINHQLYILTFKFLMISCIWSDKKKIYHPSYFIGLANFSKSIIRPRSISGHGKKFVTTLVIMGVHVLIFLPPLQYLAKRFILPYSRKTIYYSGSGE